MMECKANSSLLKKIRELTELLGVNKYRVIEGAITWYAWAVEEISKGGEIYLEKDGKKYAVIPPFLNQKQ